MMLVSEQVKYVGGVHFGADEMVTVVSVWISDKSMHLCGM